MFDWSKAEPDLTFVLILNVFSCRANVGLNMNLSSHSHTHLHLFSGFFWGGG